MNSASRTNTRTQRRKPPIQIYERTWRAMRAQSPATSSQLSAFQLDCLMLRWRSYATETGRALEPHVLHSTTPFMSADPMLSRFLMAGLAANAPALRSVGHSKRARAGAARSCSKHQDTGKMRHRWKAGQTPYKGTGKRRKDGRKAQQQKREVRSGA